MPNVTATIETERAHEITKRIASEISDSLEFTEARGWKNDVAVSPEFVMQDDDGDTHMFYVVVTSIDPGDAVDEICEGFIERKVCKKLTKEFIEDFKDELEDGSYVYVEVMFVTVKGETMDKGTIDGCTVYSRKVKSKE